MQVTFSRSHRLGFSNSKVKTLNAYPDGLHRIARLLYYRHVHRATVISYFPVANLHPSQLPAPAKLMCLLSYVDFKTLTNRMESQASLRSSNIKEMDWEIGPSE